MPLVYAITLTGILANSLVAPAIPDILDDFGRDTSAAGLLVAVGSMPGVLMAPLIGILADRFGRRAVLVPCLVSFGVFGIVAATAPSFGVLLLARLGMGFGSAGLINLSVVLIGDNFPDRNDRTHVIGRNSAVLTVGLAVLPLTSGVVTDLAGWRWALALYSVALVTAVVAWMSLDGQRPDAVGTLRQQLGGVGLAVRNPTIVTVLVLGVVLFAVVFGGFLTVMPSHMDGEFGLSAGWRGVVLAVPALSSTAAGYNLGRMSRRFGQSTILLVSTLSWTFAFVVMAAAPVLSVLLIGALIYGAGEGALIPALQAAAMDEAPEAHRGAVIAVWASSARLGQSVGPLLAGALLAGMSTTGALWVGAAVAGTMIPLVVLTPVGHWARSR